MVHLERILLSLRRTRPAIAVPAALAVVAVLAITAAGSSGDDRTRGVPVERGAVVATASADGNVESAQQLSLSFQGSGRIVQVAVKDGDRVHRGELLARLEDGPQRARLTAAQANLGSAQSRLTQTRTGLTPVELAAHRRLADQAQIAVLNARRDLADAGRVARTNVRGLRRALARAEVSGEILDLREAELRAVQERAQVRVLRRRYLEAKAARDADARDLEQALNRQRKAQNRTPADDRLTQQSLNQATYDVNVMQARVNNDNVDVTNARQALDNVVAYMRNLVLEVDNRRTALRNARRNLGDAGNNLSNGIAGARQQINSARDSLATTQAQLQVTLAQNRVGEQVKAADVAAAMADVAQAVSSVEDARKALADTELRAPTVGVVGHVNAKVGEVVRPSLGTSPATQPPSPQPSAAAPPSTTTTTPSPQASGQGAANPSPSGAPAGAAGPNLLGIGGQGGQALITLAQTEGLQVKADFSETDVARMSVGDHASVTVEPFPNRRFSSHVAQIDPIPTVAANVVTYEVTLVLDGDTYRVKPGMSATANVTLARVDHALTVPRTAVRSPQGAQPTVTVVLPNGRLEPRLVVTGLQSDSKVQILGGVGLGERVVPTISPPPNLVG
jgi:multidrug efflux pump subunit AcrA (membrane-fusion protein)